MKPVFYALTYAVIAASLVGCGMNSGKARPSSTAVSPEPRVTTSDRVVVNDETRMRSAAGTRSCTLEAVIAATRTGSNFGAIEVRVYNDIASGLYGGPRDEERIASRRNGDLAVRENIAAGELRAVQDPPPDLSEVTPRVAVKPGETTPSGAGPTGGTMQSTAAYQGGTLEQTQRSDDFHNERRTDVMNGRSRIYDDPKLTPSERARLYNQEARLSDRRGNLIWIGWLQNGERLDISSERGPIRYDYRYTSDERFHDNQGAWCNNGNRIIVPS